MKSENNQAQQQERLTKVRCPVCGYIMPVSYTEDAQCHGIFVQCKGRNCKTVFEVKIMQGQQYK